jgi:hypothetical protein
MTFTEMTHVMKMYILARGENKLDMVNELLLCLRMAIREIRADEPKEKGVK